MSASIPDVLMRYIEGLERRDIAQIAGTLAEELTVILPARTLGKPEFVAFLTAVYRAFPDWHYEHDAPEAIDTAGHYTMRWRQGGTHTEALALPGRPVFAATSKTVRIGTQQFFYRVAGDRIVEVRPDPAPGGAPWGILQQLGIEI
jgi:hypothetical protein